MITMFVPMRMMVRFDHEKVDMIMSSSPIRLMIGGRARFARHASSHQVAISGRKICGPRARIMVRLWIRS